MPRADERTILWEQPFPRLVHLLAHHPDLDTDADAMEPETVAIFAKCVRVLSSLTSITNNSL